MDLGRKVQVPDYLSRYYESSIGPFVSLSDLPPEEAVALQEKIRREGEVFASQRKADYLTPRRALEGKVRELFAAGSIT
ncbi:MAG: hypothetical protein JXA13_11570 [Anaerolineales bacterium]|nr:hypothetical protein [Anaerolineales bacterium]